MAAFRTSGLQAREVACFGVLRLAGAFLIQKPLKLVSLPGFGSRDWMKFKLVTC